MAVIQQHLLHSSVIDATIDERIKQTNRSLNNKVVAQRFFLKQLFRQINTVISIFVKQVLVPFLLGMLYFVYLYLVQLLLAHFISTSLSNLYLWAFASSLVWLSLYFFVIDIKAGVYQQKINHFVQHILPKVVNKR